MGLSEEYKKRIKESLDADQGGRLRAIAEKAKAVDAPVLIIGLGGTGVDSLLITKKLIYDTIQSEKKDGEYTDKPKNIEYLGIDTDMDYETKHYQGIYLNKRAGEIQIYTMPNVQPVLAKPELLPPYVNKWLNTDIDTKTVINGAGAVRQLGRLLLMQNMASVQNILKSKIERATSGYDETIPLYVFIFAGISGGTGSGTFIDIPYLVKAVAATVGGRPVQNIGILFMPDVNAGKSGIDSVKRESIYANGYAALKELDYLMNVDKVGDSFEQVYGTIKVGRSGDKPIPPYDICLMMSSKDRNGATIGMGDDNYEGVIHIAAETVFNFVLGDDGVTDYNGFSIQSFLSNETNNINTYMTQLGNLRHPVSYVYSIAGASSAKLPMDDIMSYLTYKAFQEVERYWNQRPGDKDVEAVMAFFGLTKNGLINAARNKIRAADVDKLDYKMIKEHPAQTNQMFEAAFKKQVAMIDSNIEIMMKHLQEQISDDNNIVNQYFLDLEKGPVFAQQCLYTTDPNSRSTITELKRMVSDFIAEEMAPEQMNILEQRAAEALAKIRNGNPIMGGTKKKDRDAYVDAMKALYNAKFKNALSERLSVYCANAASALTEKNNRIYDIVAELMETLVGIFDKYGQIKTNTAQVKGATGTTLSWSLVSTPKFITELERRMQNIPEFAVNLQEVVASFYHYLFENTELWVGDRKEDVVENINGFIYRQFENILDHSMDFFLAIIAESQNMTLQQYCEEIIHTLKKKAEVRFPIDHAFTAGAVTQPGYSFISVPSNSPQLFAAARDIAATSVTAGGAGSIVKRSGIKDRIFMMNFISATPLSLYSDLKQFYDKYKNHKNKPGLHLYEVNGYSNVDWKMLPSPYPETEWVAFEDIAEHNINETYREVLKKAIDYGYVIEDASKGTMTCRYGEPVDYQPVLDGVKIKLGESVSIPANVAKRAVRQIQSVLNDLDTRCTASVKRADLVTDEARTELKKNYEEIMFIQMFKVRDKVKEMVENHDACLAVLKEIRDRAVDDSIVENFALCRILGLVRKHKLDYIYFDRKGAAQVLTSLSGGEAAYSEHYLLDAFIQMDEASRENLISTAKDMIRNTEDMDSIKSKWSNYTQKAVLDPLEDLNLDWRDINNGEKLLSTYQMLKESVKNVEQLLKSEEDEEF
ncbi:MAG: tubulin-like doman-containing protein [Candidatus Choladocola sp.]|nr:tubulin-like doman-containing protein [Candidatus Choladocola sp.]